MNTRNVVIFGTKIQSDLARYCLASDSNYQPVAFTVDAAYIDAHEHEGLPVVAFDTLVRNYGPQDTLLCIPLGYRDINGLRRARYEQAKAWHYRFASYISSRASTWPHSAIGENTLIYEGALIQPYATVGNNVVIRAGANIGHHCNVGDHAFIAASAVFGGHVTVGEQAFVGLGAVIREGITLAERCFIGAGAVVVTDTEPDGVYVGNPARKLPRTSQEVTRES